MNKIKNLWKENRVMFVLAIVVIICIFIIMGVMFKYFFGTSKSSYGDRLNDISSLPFEEVDKNKMMDSIRSEHTLNVSVDVKGKIIYVVAVFDGTVSLIDAQNKLVDAYQEMDGKYKKLYDFNVTVSQDASTVDAYTLMGAKNASSDNFIWSNNSPIENGE